MILKGVPVLFIAFCFGSTLGDVGRKFCRNQVARYDTSIQAIDTAMREQVGLDALCNAIVSFTQEAIDTNSTCHERLERKHPSYASYWTHQMNIIGQVCSGYTSASLCSSRVPRKLMRKCVKAIPDRVTASHELLCTSSEEFMDCMKEIALVCRGSPALVTRDIIFSLSSMESATARMCPNSTYGAAPPINTSGASLLDFMQGDAPASSEPQCTDDTAVNPQLMVCDRIKFDMYNRYDCTSKRLRLACMVRVTAGTCKSSLDQSIIDATQNDYEATCNGGIPPRELVGKRSSFLPDDWALDTLNKFIE